jgi:hypothetical protein
MRGSLVTQAGKRMTILVLSIAVLLGTMALVTGDAHAALPAESEPALFLLLDPGKTFAEEGNPTVTAGGVISVASRMVIPGRGIAIECKEAEFEGSVTATEILGTATFLGCTVWSIQTGGEHKYELESETLCHIKNNLTITTSTSGGNVKISAIKHGGEYFALAEGNPFTTVSFKAGTGCVLPLSNPISGSVTAQIKSGQHVFQELKASAQIQLLTGDKLSFGTFPGYVEGEALALSSTITGPAEFIESPWGVH